MHLGRRRGHLERRQDDRRGLIVRVVANTDQWTSADRCLGRSRIARASGWGIWEVEVPSSSGGRDIESGSSQDRDQMVSVRVRVEKNEASHVPISQPSRLFAAPSRPLATSATNQTNGPPVLYTNRTPITTRAGETKRADAHTSDHQIYAPIRQECQALRGRLYIRDPARFPVGTVTAYDRTGRRGGTTGSINHPCAWIDAKDLLERC